MHACIYAACHQVDGKSSKEGVHTDDDHRLAASWENDLIVGLQLPSHNILAIKLCINIKGCFYLQLRSKLKWKLCKLQKKSLTNEFESIYNKVLRYNNVIISQASL